MRWGLSLMDLSNSFSVLPMGNFPEGHCTRSMLNEGGSELESPQLICPKIKDKSKAKDRLYFLKFMNCIER
jgi:hypothetical protein